MKIENIQEMCQNSSIEVTLHMLNRMTQRNISFSEVKFAIQNGEIIEKYPDDYPYPSCLIVGKTENNRVLHIVVGIGDYKLWLITVYEPSPEQWLDDFKIRKRVE